MRGWATVRLTKRSCAEIELPRRCCASRPPPCRQAGAPLLGKTPRDRVGASALGSVSTTRSLAKRLPLEGEPTQPGSHYSSSSPRKKGSRRWSKPIVARRPSRESHLVTWTVDSFSHRATRLKTEIRSQARASEIVARSVASMGDV
jgi:hypothetical protein